MDLWNTRNLPMPPINTFKATNTNIDIKHLKNVFQEGKIFFDKESYMKAEYAVLSTVFYRSKQKFRSAKDFKSLERVYKALGIYFKNNISYDLQCFIDLIPTKYTDLDTDETYLPNKNLVDYILVRLQGLVKLLERIVEMCKVTAFLFDRRLNTGHFWKIGFIIFSIVSRLYILTKYSAKFICNFYNKVLPFSRQLKNNGRDWLPKDYNLPNDLQQWVNVDWLDVDDELQIIEISNLPDITHFFDLVEDDDDEIQFCDEYIMVDNESDIENGNGFKNVRGFNIKQDINKLRGFNFDEDVGEVIEIKDDSILNVGDMFSQGEKESDIHGTTISDSFQSENICNVNTGEVREEVIIEIDDSMCLPYNKPFTQEPKEIGNEIVTLDESSVSNLNENSFDMGEVIEVINSPEAPKRNMLMENETSISDSSNQSIIILDDSLKSRDLNSRKKVLDPSVSKKQRKKGKAKIEKMRLAQKMLRKSNDKINKNQSNEKYLENASALFDHRLTKKTCLNNNSTSKNKGNKKILVENGAKNVNVVQSITEIDKKKNQTKKAKRLKQKQISLKTTTNKNSINNSLPKNSDITKPIGGGFDPNFNNRKSHSNAQNLSENVKKHRNSELLLAPAAKVNLKTGTGIISGRIKKPSGQITKSSLPKNNSNEGIQKGIKKRKKGKKKLKLLNNIVQTTQQTDSLKHIVNKIHHNTQSLKMNSKTKKRKNKHKRNNKQ